MTKYVMITLVSEQTIPNITPVFQEGAPLFEAIYFLQTNRHTTTIAATESVLKLRFPDIKLIKHPEIVDNGDAEITRKVAGNLIAQLKQDATQNGFTIEIVCNWTLGTKPMSLGLVQAAREHNCPTIYVDTQENRIIDPNHIYPDSDIYKRLNLNLTVFEYIKSYGLDPLKPECPVPESNLIKAANIIVTYLCQPNGKSSHSLEALDSELNQTPVAFFGAVRANRELHRKRVKNVDYTQLLVDKNSDLALALATELQQCGVVESLNKTSNGVAEIKLVNTSALFYLNGNWLEYYIYGKLRDKHSPLANSGLHSRVSQGVEFRWRQGNEVRDVRNEIDVLFTSGTEMVFISCKTGTYYLKEGSKEAVYELETLARNAGTFIKKILVLCQPRTKIPDALKDRAALFRIQLLTLEDLPEIVEKVESIFKR